MSLTSRYQALEHEQKINLWRIVFALAAFIVFEALPVAAWIASAIQINPSAPRATRIWQKARRL